MHSINFLSQTFEPVGGVVREPGVFLAATPWAAARYAGIRLTRGWWRLESDGDDGELELRVCDDTGLIFVCRPAKQGAVNLFVGQSTLAEIDLVLSAWPNRLEFRRLRLRRLTMLEVTSFLGRRVQRTVRGNRPFARLVSAARLILSGSSFGSRDEALVPTALHAPDRQSPVVDATARSAQVVRGNPLTYVLDEGQVLDTRALDVVTNTFRLRSEVRVIFGDVLEGGGLLPTPQWDDELARWFQFARLPIFFREPDEDLTSNNAWRKLLEIRRKYGPQSLMRIPLPLAIQANRREPAALSRPAIPLRDFWPFVSIVIPTKHRTDLLAKCLESLRTATNYPNLEIVVVDNGADSLALSALLEAESALQRVVRVYDGGDFNFSRLINGGVRATSGEILLLLNDDVIALEPGWLHRMVDSAMDHSVGAVGARLLYSSGDIQHAGVMLGLGGICGHLWRNLPAAEAERNPLIVNPGGRMAVTGACLAVRRDVFDRVNGLDETNFPVTLNDVDFCLRLNGEGFSTVYRGDAVLLHDESQSRGSDDQERIKRKRRRGETRRFKRMWGHLLDDDPFASPAFDRSTESGRVHIPMQRISS
jgi:GT2 family glycosyltransferase